MQIAGQVFAALLFGMLPITLLRPDATPQRQGIQRQGRHHQDAGQQEQINAGHGFVRRRGIS
ncbi:hypothetical protein D3C80_2035540 [compost metagenome]